MKKQKLSKLSLGKSKVANFNRIFGGGTWDYGVDEHTTQLVSNVVDGAYAGCETGGCLYNPNPNDNYFISKGGGCPSIDPNNGNHVPVCDR